MPDEYDFIYEGPPVKVVELGLDVEPGQEVTGPLTLTYIAGMRPRFATEEAVALADENCVDLTTLVEHGSIKVEHVQAVIDERENGPSVNATDGALKRAEELGIDIAQVEGSGPDGRIGKPDVDKYATSTGAAQSSGDGGGDGNDGGND